MITSDKINNDDYFTYLRARPYIAWPTVLQLVLALLVISGVWITVTQDLLPLWAGSLINIVAYYYLFSPIHDGTHHSLSNDKKLNDFIAAFAYIPVCFFLPGGPWARMFHMQHHRHTGKEILDPDLKISSKGSHSLWLWFTWGSHYRAYFKRYSEQLPRVKPAEWNKTRITISSILALMLVLNFPLEVFFLWFVPLHVGLSWMIALVFSYLPHHVHKRQEGEDPLGDYQATCNIVGYEWLLSPLMQFQNYHMAHHLYPTVPFYRMHKIWYSQLDKHRENKPSQINLQK